MVPGDDILYPNPWDGSQPLIFTHTVGLNTNRVWIKIFTTNFRKIYDEEGPTVSGQHSFVLDPNKMKDTANGLYYLAVVEISGGRQKIKILKFIVLR